ncbi:MAG: lysylphosphatidylglycerol synthase transmembrane domain-containing protein [Anaerolineales bacterium]
MKAWFKANRRLVLRLTGTILSLGLLIWVFYNSREDILVALAHATQPATLVKVILAAGLIFLSRLCTVARWHILLRSGGIKIPFKDTLRLTFTGLFASNFLPTSVGGDVVRLAGAMQMGYDRAVCLASIAVDRLVNMAGMSLAAPLGIYQLFQAGPLAPGTSAALAGFWEKGWGFFRRTLSSLTIWLKQPGALLAAFLFAAGNLLFVAGAYYFLIQGMGAYLPYWKLVGLVSVGYFLGLMPFTINGYGWHETIMITLFTQVAGINGGAAAIVVVLERLLMMLASLPGAAALPDVMAKMDGDEAQRIEKMERRENRE